MNTFDNVLTRENEFGHFSGSAFVVNQNRTKALMVYHKIFIHGFIPVVMLMGKKIYYQLQLEK
jgi:hypothetical protein